MPRKTSAPPLAAVPDSSDDPWGPGIEQDAAQQELDHSTVEPEEQKAPAEVKTTPRKRPAAKKAVDTGPADDPLGPNGEYAHVDSGVQFANLDDQAEKLSVLYYGPEGTGKTTAAAMMTKVPGEGRVLVVNAEGGLKRRALAAQGVDTARVAVWPPEGQRVTFEGLESLFYQIAGDLERDPDSWLGTVWDSATDIHQELLDQVVEAEMAKQAEILAKAGGKARVGNITLRDRFDNDRDDYRKMSNQFRSLLRKFRYLPCHFAVTALYRRDENEKTKRVEYGPAVTPAIATDLTGYVDQVLSCKVAEIGGVRVHFALCQPTRDERAKDRHGVLPAELVNPTFDRLYQYMVGELKEGTDEAQALLEPGAAKKAPRTFTEAQDVPVGPEHAEAPKTTASGRLNTRNTRRKPAATKASQAPGGFEDEPPF